MALRDLFDSDPRSKSQLREEIRLHGKVISDLSQQIDSFKAKAKVDELKAEKLQHEPASEYVPSNWINCKNCSQLTSIAPGRSSLCSYCGTSAPLMSNGEVPPEQTETIKQLKQTILALQQELDSAKLAVQPVPVLIAASADQNKNKNLAREVRLRERESAANRNFDDLMRREGLLKQAEAGVAKREREQKARTSEKQSNDDTTASLRFELASLKASLKASEIAAMEARALAASNKNSELIDLAEKKQDIKQIQEENGTLRTQLTNWTSFHSTREAALKKREDAITRQPAGLELQTFTQEEVLTWIFSETHPKDLKVAKGYLHLMGDGPWDNNTFAQQVRGQKFSLWLLPDADIAHLVVGHNNWSQDALLAQIESRQGQELRIYSQEMWFAAMATGRDPFDANNPKLLQAFAADHDALQFLIGQEFPWPNISDRPDDKVTIVGRGELGVEESPMHLMDYRVGKTSPHNEDERHAILDKIFSARELPFGDDCSPTYRSNWGTPKSAQRLYRMAIHIKFILEGVNGSDPRKPVAREDWISDLAWLRKTYFRKTVHGFKWPATTVP